jgi:AAA family ATP:ADP antiporter
MVAAALSGCWLVNSWWLGRRQEVLAREQEASPKAAS